MVVMGRTVPSLDTDLWETSSARVLTRIGLRIAVESPKGYLDAQIRCRPRMTRGPNFSDGFGDLANGRTI